MVFAPHVETASGIILPDDYLRAVADAVHEVGGLFVLDCIASGAMWVDMQAIGVDVLISAPQKGWSSSPCCAMVMLSERARGAIDATTSSSFACDLKKWLQIMEAYEGGAHAYHATMPTDALTRLRDVMKETQSYGFAKVRAEQEELGRKVRALFESRGLPSVAAEGFKAPGVVVSYTTDPEIQSSRKFLAEGLQTAVGRAAAVRRGAGLHDLPRRPVRAGEVAPRGPHGGATGSRAGPHRTGRAGDEAARPARNRLSRYFAPAPGLTPPSGWGTVIGATSTRATPCLRVRPISSAVRGDRSTMRPRT